MNEDLMRACKALNLAKIKHTITYLGLQKTKWHKGLVDTYRVTLTNDMCDYSFEFFDSINNTSKNDGRVSKRLSRVYPNEYDFLSVVQKYDPGTFDIFCLDFCVEFKTEREFIEAKVLYFGVVDEFEAMQKLFQGDAYKAFCDIC